MMLQSQSVTHAKRWAQGNEETVALDTRFRGNDGKAP